MKDKSDEINIEESYKFTIFDKARALFYMSLGLIYATLYLIEVVFYVAFCHIYFLFRAICLGSKDNYNMWLHMENRRGAVRDEWEIKR